ncbi:MAG TPA: hypothetical protein VK709_02490 [Candidatus Saccharimonadales bacterium]|nr:hypothetical protein [Candidatus Saccharimonadales bacterium]
MKKGTKRRSREEIEALRAAILQIVEEDSPWTVRGIFYQLLRRPELCIAKTEECYASTVGWQILHMRLEGVLPWNTIADNLRKMEWHRHYHNARERISAWMDQAPEPKVFTRDIWLNQPRRIFCFLEKDALADVVRSVVSELHVPLAVTRGFPSVTFLHEIAEKIAADGRPHIIYQLGDHDPSGVSILGNIEDRLRQFAPKVDFTFHRLAVTPAQIKSLHLPTRPTKGSDTRRKAFKGESVEVDTIPPAVLRELLRAAILSQRDAARYAQCLRAQARDRRELATFRARVADVLPETTA